MNQSGSYHLPTFGTVTTTSDYVCVPNGRPMTESTSSNYGGACQDESGILPPIPQPLPLPNVPIVNTMAPNFSFNPSAMTKVSCPPVAFPSVQPTTNIVPTSIMTNSRVSPMIGTIVAQPNKQINMYPQQLASSRLLIQRSPVVIPRPITPNIRTSIVPYGIQSTVLTPQPCCSGCLGCAGCVNCCTPYNSCLGCFGCTPLGGCCCVNPIDQTCRSCFGCNCYCC